MLKLEKLPLRARKAVRRRWLKYALRDISNNDNHAGLERVYKITDPWSLDSPLEHARFAATNSIILQRFGMVDRLLEMGSSEGVQSVYLRKACRNLHGIEVSPTAVERARARVPDAQFSVGDLLQQTWHDTTRFDLVVACEVLYYVNDVKAALEQMNRLGNACFVSFFSPEAHKLSALIDAMPRVEKSWLTCGGVTWLLAWWENRSRS